MMRWITKQNILKAFVSGFLVLSFVVISYAPTPLIPRAEAIPAIIIGGIGTIQETITAIATTASRIFDSITSWATRALALKEFALDAVAWWAINLVIHQIAQSTIRWINSGFQGSPAFVTDLNGFLRDIGDRVAGEFIYSTGMDALCSPFKLDVQMALTIQYGRSRDSRYFDARCTLSDVVSNVENFMNGDFLAGGWEGWFHMTTNPKNNPYGALLLAETELSARLSSAKGQEVKKLDFGKGFFSKTVCTEYEDTASGDIACARTQIVTPGSTIENQLNSALNLPSGRLLVADEINEVLAALFSQLVSQMLSGAGGLLGLTNSGYGSGSGNYFQQLQASASSSFVGATGTLPEYVPPPPINPGQGGGGGNAPASACGITADPVNYNGTTNIIETRDFANFNPSDLMVAQSSVTTCAYQFQEYPAEIVVRERTHDFTEGDWVEFDPFTLFYNTVRINRTFGAKIFRFRTPSAGNTLNIDVAHQNIDDPISDFKITLSRQPCDFTNNLRLNEISARGSSPFRIVTNAREGERLSGGLQLEANQVYYLTLLDQDETDWVAEFGTLGPRIELTLRVNPDFNPPPANNASCVPPRAPTGNTPPLSVSPRTTTSNTCTGASFNFSVSGGQAVYEVSSTGFFTATPSRFGSCGTSCSGSTAISGLATGSGLRTFVFRDNSSPVKTATATVMCR